MNALLKKLSELEFMAVDILLYIDTHPDNKEAIKKYNEITGEANRLRNEYEEQVGPLYNYVSSLDANKSDWINSPWPWEKTFGK